jgi:molecular chaperone DnaK
MTPLIERNTTIPTQKKQVFSTAADNQPAVTIVVLQGERPMAQDNKEIGRFDLSDIPPAPRGTPQIEVAFDIDADGILHVSAKDKQSGKLQKIKIEAKSGLSEAEIQRKVKEAEDHAEEDKKKKEKIEVKNNGEATLFRAEKALQDYKDKLPAHIVQEITSRIEALKKALQTEDLDTIRDKDQALQKSMQNIGSELSKAESDTKNKPPSANKDHQKGDVEEAEVEVLDDNDTKS